MEKVSCIVRNILLVVFMAFIYVVIGPNTDPSADYVLYMALAVLLYFILGIATFLFKTIRVKRMEEDEGYHYLLNYFMTHKMDLDISSTIRRFILLGALAGVVYLILNGGSLPPSESFFSSFFLWCLVALPFIFVISVARNLFILPSFGEGAYTKPQKVWKIIISDFGCWYFAFKHREKNAVFFIKLILIVLCVAFLTVGLLGLL